jgi:hypothetical protein
MGGLKKILLAGALSASLLATPLIAEKPKPKFTIDVEGSLGVEQNGIDYSTLVPQLTTLEQTQIDEIMRDIYPHNNKVNLYPNLSELSKDFSENQKIVLLSTISNFLYNGYYSEPDYICANISSDIEQLAEKMGIRTATVTGKRKGQGHAYNILKTENGTTIVDGYESVIVTTNTKNIEKALEAYQKSVDTVAFQHLFFEDNKFKYILITKDGKNFLDFIEYDSSSKPSLEMLINPQYSKPDFKINLKGGNYFDSIKLNALGFFAKTGMILGDSSSAMKDMTLFQAGYRGDFLIPEVAILRSDVSAVYGSFFKYSSISTDIGSAMGDFIIFTNQEKGLNFDLRVAGNVSSELPLVGMPILFHDFLAELGISYKIPLKKLTITPYAIAQSNFFPDDLINYIFVPTFKELQIGTILDIPISPNANISINPNYFYRTYEQEFGANVKLNTGNIKSDIWGYVTKSNYEFCPDKGGFNVGVSVPINKNFDINLNCKDDMVNYDGEIDNKFSFSVQGKLKF